MKLPRALGDRQKTILSIIIVVVASIPLAIPYLKPGYQIAHDRPVPYMRVAELGRALSDGQLPPRWFPNFDGGYGSPYPSFYALGFYYISTLFRWLGLSVGSSVELTAYLVLLASGLAMFALARRMWDAWGGAAAAVLYMYVPYHLVNAYIRGALSELTAFVWYPLIVLGLIQIQSETNPKSIRICALAVAGLLLTHNISAMIFLPAAAFMALALVWKRTGSDRQGLNYLNLLHAWVAGGLIAGFLWLPILFERQFIRTEYFLQFDFRGDFINWPELISTASTHTFTLELGIVHLFGAAVAIVLTAIHWRSTEHRLLVTICTALAAGYIFLTNYHSTQVWETVLFLEFAQFPWRMLGPAGFLLSLVAASGLSHLKSSTMKLHICIALTLTVFYLHHPLIDIPRRSSTIDTSPAGICKEVWGTQDYRPVWSKTQFWQGIEPPDPFSQADVLKPCPEGFRTVGETALTVSEVSKNSRKWEVHYSLVEEQTIIVPQYYYPGWSAWLDNEPKTIAVLRPSGLMIVDSPHGSHKLTLAYTGTLSSRIGNLASVLGILLALFPNRVQHWLATKLESSGEGCR